MTLNRLLSQNDQTIVGALADLLTYTAEKTGLTDRDELPLKEKIAALEIEPIKHEFYQLLTDLRDKARNTKADLRAIRAVMSYLDNTINQINTAHPTKAEQKGLRPIAEQARKFMIAIYKRVEKRVQDGKEPDSFILTAKAFLDVWKPVVERQAELVPRERPR